VPLGRQGTKRHPVRLGPARRQGGKGTLRRGLLHIEAPAEAVLSDSWAAWTETDEFGWVEGLRVVGLQDEQTPTWIGWPPST
jgi:hypothetical protein